MTDPLNQEKVYLTSPETGRDEIAPLQKQMQAVSRDVGPPLMRPGGRGFLGTCRSKELPDRRSQVPQNETSH